jgi:hypothetical protein
MNIDNLAKNLPIGSVFIILCSSVKLVVYYNLFNITIVDYLEVQEYLTLFIDDLIYYILIFGIGLILELFSSPINIEVLRTQPNVRVVKSKTNDVVIYLLIAILLILIGFVLYKDIPLSKKASYIGVASFGILTSLYFLLTKRLKNFPYYLYIAIGIFIYSIMFGYEDGYKVLEQKNLKQYKIQIEDKVIQTDSGLHYLGKSRNYIFLYNSVKECSEIYNMKGLVKIEIKNGS